jgi:hypothetical protein
MDRLFTISVIFLFSFLILNTIFIVKEDIEENERKELNQKIENSIIQPINKFRIETLKTKQEKEIDHKLIERKVIFA